MASYNLDIQEYSLEDLFNLFEIPFTSEIRKEHIRLAKQKVIMSHPDKSGLPSDYFIFYKKAFEMIVLFYESQNKISQNVPTILTKEEEMVYEPISQNQHISKSEFSQNIQKTKHFNKKFNELFEKNEMIEKTNTKKNEWFHQENNIYEGYSVHNTSQINNALEKIKKEEKERSMALYRGVSPLLSNGNHSVKSFYDEEEDTDEYICSDPFSKLKYDDLRKVHKDQTIFIISENDIQNTKTYSSVDEYSRSRDIGMEKPMEKEKAERWFLEEEKKKQDAILRKQHTDELKMMQNIEKNKNIMASFLRIL